MFDAALYLGVCDKIVPGLLIGALAFGHLRRCSCRGPMTPGIPNSSKPKCASATPRRSNREELLRSRGRQLSRARHLHVLRHRQFQAGAARSNGLAATGDVVRHPGTPLRDALTRAAVERALRITALRQRLPAVGELIDERAIVNAIVALLATAAPPNNHPLAGRCTRGRHRPRLGRHRRALADRPLLARVYPTAKPT